MLEEHEASQQEKMFEEAHRRATERIKAYEECIITVLKGHLAAEQALNYLLTAGKRRKRGRKFAGKMYVARGLFVEEMTKELWKLLEVGNDLRNSIAHGDKQGTIDNRIIELRKAFIDANTPEQKKHIEAMSEPQMITMAFSQCSSHITVAADRIERAS
ncbi:hypothetical protein E4K64_33580 [Bradyrhizobium frederickii]|uniref:RiboL-PSP-HEPN domain-containing protein n=2 Tax=Bradyrhizobium frederickii TaxID=2560054 RepID=A0A4Y9NRH9_9BRAD|nr:hypothetical protein E4K64_33580 [Bradyrhizobium frederickii]